MTRASRKRSCTSSRSATRLNEGDSSVSAASVWQRSLTCVHRTNAACHRAAACLESPNTSERLAGSSALASSSVSGRGSVSTKMLEMSAAASSNGLPARTAGASRSHRDPCTSKITLAACRLACWCVCSGLHLDSHGGAHGRCVELSPRACALEPCALVHEGVEDEWKGDDSADAGCDPRCGAPPLPPRCAATAARDPLPEAATGRELARPTSRGVSPPGTPVADCRPPLGVAWALLSHPWHRSAPRGVAPAALEASSCGGKGLPSGLLLWRSAWRSARSKSHSSERSSVIATTASQPVAA